MSNCCYSWITRLLNRATLAAGDDYAALDDETSIVLKLRRPLLQPPPPEQLKFRQTRPLILRYYYTTYLRLYIIDGDAEKECRLRCAESLKTAKFVASCDGLVLLSWLNGGSTRYGVFNPLMNEDIVIVAESPINRRTQPCGFFFDPSEKDYKILAVGRGGDNNNNRNCYEYQIYSFGSKNWRRIKKPYFHLRPTWKSNGGDGNATVFNGALHWYIGSDAIMAFDMISEELSIKYLPFIDYLFKLYYFNGFLVKRGDDLCFFVVGCVEPEMDVWVLQDYEKWSWCKKYVIDLNWDLIEFPLTEPGLTAFSMVRVVGFHGNEVVLFWRHRGLFVYDLGLRRVERVWVKKLKMPRERCQSLYDLYCGFASYVAAADDRRNVSVR